MFNAELRSVLFEVISSWQVLVVSFVIILYIFLVNYVTRKRKRPPPPPKPVKSKDSKKAAAANEVDEDDSELDLEE
jgi:flagellar biosynthesis/type III secretory pathway M-ring protein FliF/YscJ